MEDTGIAAVADAPEIAESTAPETTTVETDATEVDTDGAVGETEAQEGETQPETGEQADGPLMLDGNRPSPKVTKLLQDIKAKDPRFATQLRRALIDNAQLGRTFPGGLKDAVALQQKFDSLGGEHGLATMQNDLAVFGEAYGQFADGSPAFAETLAEDNPEAFAKIAPAVISKYESANPEAFGAFLASKMFSEIRNSGLYSALKGIRHFVDKQNPLAVETWDEIANAINSIQERAEKHSSPAAPATTKSADPRESEFKAREDALRLEKWGVERDRHLGDVFNKEYARLAAGRKVSPDQFESIKEMTISRVNKALESKELNEGLKKYFDANDQEGYSRFYRSRLVDIVRVAMKQPFERTMGAKRGPETGTPKAQQNGAPAAPATPSKGFTWVSGKPALTEVDMGRTDRSDWLAGKAVMKDGRRVQWRVQ